MNDQPVVVGVDGSPASLAALQWAADAAARHGRDLRLLHAFVWPAYAAAYGVTSNWPEVPGTDFLKVPVVGPWIALGKSGCASDDPGCGDAAMGAAGSPRSAPPQSGTP